MSTLLIDAIKRGFAPTAGSSPWVLVIGDLMLDRYLWGKVERVSPEAPVPVVLLDKENCRPGGAANVAANLAGLGLHCRVLGCIGSDDNGHQLADAIAKSGVDTQAIVELIGRPTITKTRIVGGHQQILRVDRESNEPLTPDELQQLEQAIERMMAQSPAVVVLSDYNKGVLHPAVCELTIPLARRAGIPVLVDPKGRDYSKYQGATALTPNRREISEACGGIDDIEGLLNAADQLRSRLGLEFLAVTRSEEGISLIEQGHRLQIPAMAKQVFDVSGAGDTVIATLAAGMIAGLSRYDALHLANLAAGIVVGKVGTVAITTAELLDELANEDIREQADKVCDLDRLLMRVAGWKAASKTVVFTNGCFDLLHSGHVTYLEQARKLGHKLIVGINTDRSVSALKGPSRPVIHEADRARVLAALEAVDAVILFDEDTPLKLIDKIRPHVLVKGSDYAEDEVVGGSQVKVWGGRVALIDLVPGRSTSNIIGKFSG